MTPAEMATKLREQQQALDRQRQELDRQRADLERQQRQLEALAAALEAQQRGGAAPAAATATAPSWGAGAPAGATPGGATAAAPASPPLFPDTVAPFPGASTASSPEGRGLRFSGYADMAYQSYDFYENAQDTKPQRRGKADLARFVLAPRYDFGHGWSFFGEIEFEHGGTGSSVEYERDEAGEFESEIEKGGEVALEQLYLQYSWSPEINFRVGEIVVPVGMVNVYHEPTEYFTIGRSQGESALIPVVWHEPGVAMLGTVGQMRYQVEFVTALDSTGFSGYGFVSNGMQSKFEGKNATAFAFVAQAEYAFVPGALAGGSVYFGNSSPNRARTNLDVAARVTLAEIHGRYEVGPVIVRGQWLGGWLQNSEAVTEANLRVFNGDVLGVSRTPIGSRAYSWFLEGGYDLLSLVQRSDWGRLDLFGRYEAYDTHASTEGKIVRVPRYAQQVATFGLNYKPKPGIVFKGEYARLTTDGTPSQDQNFFGLGVGFEY